MSKDFAYKISGILYGSQKTKTCWPAVDIRNSKCACACVQAKTRPARPLAAAKRLHTERAASINDGTVSCSTAIWVHGNHVPVSHAYPSVRGHRSFDLIMAIDFYMYAQLTVGHLLAAMPRQWRTQPLLLSHGICKPLA